MQPKRQGQNINTKCLPRMEQVHTGHTGNTWCTNVSSHVPSNVCMGDKMVIEIMGLQSLDSILVLCDLKKLLFLQLAILIGITSLEHKTGDLNNKNIQLCFLATCFNISPSISVHVQLAGRAPPIMRFKVSLTQVI